jgi:hypothetical protein
MKPAYAGFVDVAREQLKQDDELTDAQLFAVLSKTEGSKEVTLEGELKKIQKKVEKLISGEVKDHTGGALKDQSPELIQVQELMAQRLAALMQAKQDAEDDEQLAKAAAILAKRGAESVAIAAYPCEVIKTLRVCPQRAVSRHGLSTGPHQMAVAAISSRTHRATIGP